jgi:hypothetical protein
MHVDFECIKDSCHKRVTVLHAVSPFADPPKCECGGDTEPVRDNTKDCGVSFRGITSPGGNGSPNFNRLPGEIRDWAKKKYDQDRHYENEVKKPMTWPDGTHQKRIK